MYHSWPKYHIDTDRGCNHNINYPFIILHVQFYFTPIQISVSKEGKQTFITNFHFKENTSLLIKHYKQSAKAQSINIQTYCEIRRISSIVKPTYQSYLQFIQQIFNIKYLLKGKKQAK
jgi:hypothetical protein